MQPIKKRYFGRAAVLFAVCATTALATGAFNRQPMVGVECQSQTGQPPQGEPTNAAEAAVKKAKADAELEAKYQAWVVKLPPAQQAWERVLQENLGSFYLPIHKREKIAGKSNAWDFLGSRVAEAIQAALKLPSNVQPVQ